MSAVQWEQTGLVVESRHHVNPIVAHQAIEAKIRAMLLDEIKILARVAVHTAVQRDRKARLFAVTGEAVDGRSVIPKLVLYQAEIRRGVIEVEISRTRWVKIVTQVIPVAGCTPVD